MYIVSRSKEIIRELHQNLERDPDDMFSDNLLLNSKQQKMSTPSKLKNPEVLNWIFFISKGIKDNTDLMRTQMLCMEVCGQCEKGTATVESIKKTSGYMSCTNDIPSVLISDEKIQEMIDFS